MNGTARPGLGADEIEDGSLDPNLLSLFEEANASFHDEAFVSATLTRLARQRRRRLIGRCAATALVMLIGALVAPYVALATLTIASWLVEQLPPAGVALASCACATLLAWRIARRQLN